MELLCNDEGVFCPSFILERIRIPQSPEVIPFPGSLVAFAIEWFTQYATRKLEELYIWDRGPLEHVTPEDETI